jgi:head-tail adaptor
VRVERKTLVRAANGDVTNTWATVTTLWASIDSEPVLERHKEPLYDDQQKIIKNFEMWFRADALERFEVTANDRFVWRDMYIDIQDIHDNQNKGRFTRVTVRTGANLG